LDPKKFYGSRADLWAESAIHISIATTMLTKTHIVVLVAVILASSLVELKAKEEFAHLEEVNDEFALLDEEGDMIGKKEVWWVTRKIPRIASCLAMAMQAYADIGHKVSYIFTYCGSTT
jgi:hypothetical protein